MAVRVLDDKGAEVYRWTVLMEMNLNRSQVLQAAQKELKEARAEGAGCHAGAAEQETLDLSVISPARRRFASSVS